MHIKHRHKKAGIIEETFFPLMAWNSTTWNTAVCARPDYFKEMKECGLTIAGFVRPCDLDACEEAGLRAIVEDPRCGGYNWKELNAAQAGKNVRDLLKETAQAPAVYGDYLADEPSAASFRGLATGAAMSRDRNKSTL